jgi:hypothetical protein
MWVRGMQVRNSCSMGQVMHMRWARCDHNLAHTLQSMGTRCSARAALHLGPG